MSRGGGRVAAVWAVFLARVQLSARLAGVRLDEASDSLRFARSSEKCNTVGTALRAFGPPAEPERTRDWPRTVPELAKGLLSLADSPSGCDLAVAKLEARLMNSYLTCEST